MGTALAVDRALRDNGVERADAKLTAALRAATDNLNARVARARAEAESLARSRRVQRALAERDRNELAAVTRSVPDPVLLRTSGSLAIGRQVDGAIRRSASVEGIGEVTAFVPLDDELLRSLERPADVGAGVLPVIRDGAGDFARMYGADGSAVYVVRPDGYLSFSSAGVDVDALTAHLAATFGTSVSTTVAPDLR